MVFADFQQQINLGWKKRSEQLEPVRQRKKNLCPKCGKQGFTVKMDYLKNIHERYNICIYNIDIYKCPRCNFVDKKFMRIEGTGRIGVNLGRIYGNE